MFFINILSPVKVLLLPPLHHLFCADSTGSLSCTQVLFHTSIDFVCKARGKNNPVCQSPNSGSVSLCRMKVSFNAPASCSSRWLSDCFFPLLHILENFTEYADYAPCWCLFFFCPRFDYACFSCKTLNCLFLAGFMQEQYLEFSKSSKHFFPG